MTDQQESVLANMVLRFNDSAFIKIWCEYDICGNFGGNNDQEICNIIFPADLELAMRNAYVDERVKEHIISMTDLSVDDISGLFGWDYVQPVVL